MATNMILHKLQKEWSFDWGGNKCEAGWLSKPDNASYAAYGQYNNF